MGSESRGNSRSSRTRSLRCITSKSTTPPSPTLDSSSGDVVLLEMELRCGREDFLRCQTRQGMSLPSQWPMCTPACGNLKHRVLRMLSEGQEWLITSWVESPTSWETEPLRLVHSRSSKKATDGST